ncbi:tol-pal system protein YbgF [Planctomycetes bacterium Pla163]|uniref:Tol-pal system protein YbgF n=1 Tax=Rohdeia mirabilis TaxID=2528008 RepID=A0A518D3C1_9BACT|nr:tol-pal system protein YbgF [Planctomycetes bacterium Pla163]
MSGRPAPFVATVVAALAVTAVAPSSLLTAAPLEPTFEAQTVVAGPLVGTQRTAPLVPATPAPATRTFDDADDAAQYIAGLADKGLDDLVVKEGRAFLKQHGTHARATLVRYLVGDVLFERDDFAGARPLFAAVAEANGFERRREARFRLGQCALELGDASAAIAALEACLADDPDYLVAPATFLLGEARFAADDVTGAEAAYWAVMQLDAPGTYAFDAACAMCWTAKARGAHDQAAQRVEACIAAADEGEPRLPELWLLLGETRYTLGQHAAALAAFGAVAAGEQRAAAERGTAFALVALGRDAEAAERFEAIATTAPTDPFANEARVRAAAAHVRSGAFDRALQMADSVPQAARSAELHYWRGRALAGLGRHADALESLDRAAASKPSTDLAATITSARADALYALGRTDEAARVYEASGGDYALHAAAVARANAGDFTEAARLARELFERFPDSAYGTATRFVLGEAAFQSGDLDTARAAFAAVTVASGASPEDARRARSRTAWCDFRAGRFDAAESAFEALSKAASVDELSREALFMSARAAEELAATLDGSRATEPRRRAVARYERFVDSFAAANERPEGLLRLARLVEGEAGERRLAQLAQDHAQHELAPDALLELAERRSARGDLAGAKVAYGALAELAPKGPHALHALLSAAWCANQLGAHDDARTTLRALLKRSDLDAERRASAHELLAFVEAARGDGRASEAAVEALAKDGVEATRVLAAARRAAAALTAAGEPARAAALMDGVAAIDASAVDVVRAASVEAVFARLDASALEQDKARRTRLVDEAERTVRTLAAAHDRAADASSGDGSADAKGRESGTATRPAGGGGRGGSNGAANEAATATAPLTPLDPNLAEAAFFVGESRYAAGLDAQALELYDLAARTTGTTRERALYKGGFTALRLEDWPGVDARFGAFAAEFGKSPLLGEVLFLLGEARYRTGDDAGAIEALALMRTRFAQHELATKARFRLGLAQSRAGLHADAARTLADLVRTAPDFDARAEAELWRGRSLAALGDGRAARAAFAAVLERDKGLLSARARLELGALSLAANDLDDALSQFLKVAVLYEACDEVADALVRAGGVLERQGETSAALAQYREVVKDHADSPFASAAKGRIAALEGAGG